MKQSPSLIAEQAAGWFVRLHDTDADGVAPALQHEFDLWYAADERHRQEYDQFARLWQQLDGVKNLAGKRHPGMGSKATGQRRMRAAMWGVLALAMGLGLSVETHTPYATAYGEQRHWQLADGVALDANSQTQVVVHERGWSRRVELVQGEIQLTVDQHSWKPLTVTTRHATLRDIGTTFVVRESGERGHLAVLDGAVAIERPERVAVMISGGSQVSYSATELSVIRPVNREQATAWTQGLWVFHATPLSEVVHEINRHYPDPVVLASPALGRYPVSGVFAIRDRDGLLKALKNLYPVRVQTESGQLVLRER